MQVSVRSPCGGLTRSVQRTRGHVGRGRAPGSGVGLDGASDRGRFQPEANRLEDAISVLGGNGNGTFQTVGEYDPGMACRNASPRRHPMPDRERPWPASALTASVLASQMVPERTSTAVHWPALCDPGTQSGSLVTSHPARHSYENALYEAGSSDPQASSSFSDLGAVAQDAPCRSSLLENRE